MHQVIVTRVSNGYTVTYSSCPGTIPTIEISRTLPKALDMVGQIFDDVEKREFEYIQCHDVKTNKKKYILRRKK